MTQAETIAQNVSFPTLLSQIAGLTRDIELTANAGHMDLGEGLWLSCDPDGQTKMTCATAETGFRLTLEQGDSGKWSSFGMRLPIEVLSRGRYIGLLIEARTSELVSFTPSLRYRLKGGEIADRSPALPVLLLAGHRTDLSHIPLDPELLERTAQCELNLYFHTDRMALDIIRLEPMLMS